MGMYRLGLGFIAGPLAWRVFFDWGVIMPIGYSSRRAIWWFGSLNSPTSAQIDGLSRLQELNRESIASCR